tara:strand:- start:209978 stop:210139 length:162 start_codon:yes stop_codon:yes gene_type:complete
LASTRRRFASEGIKVLFIANGYEKPPRPLGTPPKDGNKKKGSTFAEPFNTINL